MVKLQTEEIVTTPVRLFVFIGNALLLVVQSQSSQWALFHQVHTVQSSLRAEEKYHPADIAVTHVRLRTCTGYDSLDSTPCQSCPQVPHHHHHTVQSSLRAIECIDQAEIETTPVKFLTCTGKWRLTVVQSHKVP